MRLFRPWSAFSRLYPGALFRIETQEKLLLLTFDDGPDPASTPGLLEILEKYNIKAAFFCTGIKAEKYPWLTGEIKAAGHVVGNHGYSHLNGWITSCRNYLADVAQADNLTSPELFRPPYGRLTMCQYYTLLKKYSIVLWDLMPYDFDSSFGHEGTLEVLKKKIRPGSIIVLHDTPLSCAGEILEEFLNYAVSGGWFFKSIDQVHVGASSSPGVGR
jgi:peptidoglycan/xylan/chitin deacetylase (PgdA/CDA1 family)